MIWFFFFFFLFFFCDPIRDPIRDLIHGPIRDPVRSNPVLVNTAWELGCCRVTCHIDLHEGEVRKCGQTYQWMDNHVITKIF